MHYSLAFLALCDKNEGKCGHGHARHTGRAWRFLQPRKTVAFSNYEVAQQ
ncbi:hypothetical protein HUK65_04685 [Rhodobacteraceae bacterium 2376]|uniref:Uncharacterized protein n=1 Tax=Rhabdonatronobacter sediminivivens TaxID=2743469 RepID=A0A7Z0HXX9_9RHOB|nr:hypothetical protein [Rhabdonatronobacter sediminivivens]NYS24282.1 hypothetical protein [Rhabdonatronobacter sediminivivens]